MAIQELKIFTHPKVIQCLNRLISGDRRRTGKVGAGSLNSDGSPIVIFQAFFIFKLERYGFYS